MGRYMCRYRHRHTCAHIHTYHTHTCLYRFTKTQQTCPGICSYRHRRCQGRTDRKPGISPRWTGLSVPAQALPSWGCSVCPFGKVGSLPALQRYSRDAAEIESRRHSRDADITAPEHLQAHFRRDRGIQTITGTQIIVNTMFSTFVCQQSEMQAPLPPLLLFSVSNVAIFSNPYPNLFKAICTLALM